jgi:hypothetical protein
MTKTKPADIYIRLPENKKYIKAELLKIAEKNNMSLQGVATIALEWFIEEKKKREFTIKIK